MNNFLELISVPMSAGDSKSFELSGDYFEIIEAQYPVTVTLSDRNGVQTGRMANAEQSFYMKNTGFGNINITSPSAQIVRIGYGSGEAGTRRTAGIVQVVDGGKARTLALNAFVGFAGVGPVAAQLPHVMLWNPSTTKNVVVEQILAASSLASNIVFWSNFVTVGGLYTQPNGKAKKLGSPDSVSQLYVTTNAAALATGNRLFLLSVPAASSQSFKLTEPIILPPSSGILGNSYTPNADLNLTFEYYEDPI